MRLRLRLTIDLTRKPAEVPAEPVDDRPAIYDVSGAMVERAEPSPIGFRIPTPPGITPVYLTETDDHGTDERGDG